MSRRVAILVAALAAAYFVVLLANTSYFVAGPDSSGYCNEAKMLAAGKLHIDVTPMRDWNLDPETIYMFTPLGFCRGVKSYTMVPTYPAGLPIHMAVASWIGGWSIAPFVVVPIFAMLTLLVMFLTAREMGLSANWSLVAVLILATFAVFIQGAIQPSSDDFATFWALLAIYLAVRGNPVAAGAAFAAGVWARPTNFLLVLPLAFALGWKFKPLLKSASGAIPIGAALAWYNTMLYGKPWKTGYGSVVDVFNLHAFRHCAVMHPKWTAMLLTPLIFPGALLVLFDRRVDRMRRALLAVWFFVFLGFYVFWDVCDDPFTIRFLLPGIPALILGFVLVLSHGLRRATAVAIILVLIVVGTGIHATGKYSVLRADETDSVYPETVRWVERQLPSNALVISGLLSGAFLYNSNRFTIRWDQLSNENRLQKLRDSAASALPWYAVLSDVECQEDCLRATVPGRWTKLGRNRDITLWRYEGR